MTAKKIKLNDMSYKIIEKNEYGTLVIDDEILQGVSDVCRKCKYLSNCEDEWMKCIINTYYLSDSEAEKLESEISPETFTINDMYVTSKQLFDCQDELKASKKELLNLQNENKQLKERVEELEGTIENKTTELITEREDVFSGCFSEITKTKCCGVAPITNENFCPNCGRKIVR